MQSFRPLGVRRALPLLLTLCLAGAACSDDSDDGGETPTPTPEPDVVASSFEAELAAEGLDTTNLPTWEELEHIWESKEPEGHEAVYLAAKPFMELFAASLGVECSECHTEPDSSGTPDRVVTEERRNLVVGMWDEWVHGLRLKEGGLLFCDSCHLGSTEFLARDDENALASWMDVNFVSNLTRVDGQQQACESCHNQPFDEYFLTRWEQGEYSSAQ